MMRMQGWIQTQFKESDKTPFTPFYAVTFVYTLLMTLLGHRPLWMDELATYYLAKSPTVERLFTAALKNDFNPPLQAALTALSVKTFGDSPFAARLPSVIAFWIASVCIYNFAKFRLGRFYGLTAMLAFWATDFLRYGVEARPYALMIAFLGVAMVCWQQVYERKRRWVSILGLSPGVAGLLSAHVFGALLLVPLAIAELVRSYDRKTLDWKIWFAFLAPMPLIALYLPMIGTFGQVAIAYPLAFQASFAKAFEFYGLVFSTGSVTLIIAFAAAILAARSNNAGDSAAAADGDGSAGYQRHEIIFLAGLLVVPFIINFLLMRYSAAFWPRYGIGAGIGVGCLFAYFVARATRISRSAAGVAATILVVGFVATRFPYPFFLSPQQNLTKALSIKDIPLDLPIVAASGVTFLEMNHREDDAFLSRTYYLTDPIAAKRYANATLFENYFSRQDLFPLRGHVVPYQAFIRQSPRFLVLCTLNYPEDWLMAKLLATGASVRLLGEMDEGYHDKTVFEVTVNSTMLTE